MTNRTTTSLGSLGNGRFVILDELGEGGMAIVYLALDTHLDVKRAIKKLKPEIFKNEGLRKRFLVEAQTMAKLESPSIARIYDIVEGNDEVFIVMELVENGSLIDQIEQRGSLSLRYSAEVCLSALESLQVAHKAKVIHRDIKPHNILIDQNGVFKITDFGIAKKSDQKSGQTGMNDVMGTFAYMAPEQYKDARNVDCRADLYAVGAMLYHCLVGREPHMLCMIKAKPGLLDPVPKDFKEFIRRATDMDPNDRYQTAREMRKVLKLIYDELPDEATEAESESELIETPVVEPSEFLELITSGSEDGGNTFDIKGDDSDYSDRSIFDQRTQLPWEDLPLPWHQRCVPMVLDVGILAACFVLAFVFGIEQVQAWVGENVEVEQIEIVELTVVVPEPTVEFQLVEPVEITEPVVHSKVESIVRSKVESKSQVKAVAKAEPKVVETEVKVEAVAEPAVKVLPEVKVEPVIEIVTEPEPELAVEVVQAPTLNHKVITSLQVGQSFTPEVRIVPAGNYRVVVYYRAKGASYRSKRLVIRGGVYTALISVDEIYANGLDYKITATPEDSKLKKLSSGSGIRPHRVTVE